MSNSTEPCAGLLEIERTMGLTIPAFAVEGRCGDDLAAILEREIADPSKRARLAHIVGCSRALERREIIACAFRLLGMGERRAVVRRHLMARFPSLSRTTCYAILARCVELHCQQLRTKAQQTR